MVQLYFLSLVFNGLAGFLFVFGDFSENSPAEDSNKFSIFGDGFRLILGILTALTGVLKLLSPMKDADDRSWYILGDLLPSVAGILAGFILVYGFYRKRSSHSADNGGKINRIGEISLHYRKAVGIVLLTVSTLHFIFPYALFL